MLPRGKQKRSRLFRVAAAWGMGVKCDALPRGMNSSEDMNRKAAPIERRRKSWRCPSGQILAVVLFGNFLWAAPHAVFAAATYEASGIVPPKPLREFRGAWIA